MQEEIIDSFAFLHNLKNEKEEALHKYLWQEQVVKVLAQPEGSGEMLASVMQDLIMEQLR